ncbi:amino acid permease [Halovenus rubra]|uniref:Amino acid permease n=2 Tax=Halovenus rubra TaxID=869890 RepID=A0ACC7E1G7_9EURY|nr:amino acid permease [Halovenus rubra]
MSEEELAKDLGLLSAMMIGIGTMIGAGIFVLPGVASQEAGPMVILSFVIGGVIAMINALSVSELGTAMPKAGGGYYYVNRGLGPLFGSISGMGDWMGLAFASAFYCIGFGGYLADLLGDITFSLPAVGSVYLIPTFDLVFLEISQTQVGAVIAGVIFVGVNYLGAKETGGIQTVIVLTLLSILTVFAITGWFSFDWGTLTQDGLAPDEAGGYGAVLPATGVVFVSFLGYAKIATVAEELKNPGRNLPIAVVGSVGIVTAIYAILVGIMIGVVPWDTLDQTVPVSQVAEVTFEGWPVLSVVGVTLMTFAAMLATASSANASILSSARINFAMGRDEIVPNWLNRIHPNFATPYRSILVTGVMILVFIIFLGSDLKVLSTAASVLHLIVYTLMNLALIAFREGNVSDYDPDFRVPLYPVTPILGALFSFGLIYFIQWEAQLLSGLFVAGAVAWYFLYARGKTEVEGVAGQYIRDRSDEMPDLAVSAAKAVSPQSAATDNIMVPVSNPETEDELLAIACTLANQNDGVVHAVHVVDVPDQTALDYASDRLQELGDESEELLENARQTAESYDASVETHTVFSHRPFDEIFSSAKRLDASTVVLGWSPNRPWTSGRTGGGLEELTMDLPCDFLVFKDRGFDPANILLPTAGGPDSGLSAEVAKAMRETHDSTVSILHVVGAEAERDKATDFIGDWATDHGLDDANLLVETDGETEAAIERHASDHSMVLIGATSRGLLTRLVSNSLVFDVVDDVECSVMLSERPTNRSLRERLLGRRSDNRTDMSVEMNSEESTTDD